MIEVKSITKSFGNFTALDKLSLTVPKGSVYGLVGPNGSGKSTLIRHLTGIYRQDSGEVLYDGEQVYENTALKEKIAYIPDDLYHFASATTKDMRKFYASVYKSFDSERYEKLRSAFNLDENAQIRRLSKGMQKQSAIWVLSCVRPEYIILDEPVDGLDPVMRRQVWSILLNDVEQRGTTVLVSSHNLRELEDVCDHVGILDHGRLLLERSLSELQDNIVKMQVIFNQNNDISDLDILHQSATGKLNTIIVRSTQEALHSKMQVKSPLFYELLPLTLEEIFIYELGDVNYETKEILL